MQYDQKGRSKRSYLKYLKKTFEALTKKRQTKFFCEKGSREELERKTKNF